MRILHYALGFPPYRSGGLTKFCMDLMRQQNKEGHQVALMWPGQMRLISKKVSIKDRGFNEIGIQSFEVINPLPVPYDEGIANIAAFTFDSDRGIYESFLDRYKPNVIHIHTLMGLHKSFVYIAQEKKIRIIFTAHDYFPICPKVMMFRHSELCRSIQDYKECGSCNSTALGIQKIKVLQSPVYRILKESFFVRRLRKKHRDNYLSERTNDAKSIGTAEKFKKLREYYYALLQMMDCIHYNSTVTKAVYESVFSGLYNRVIPITHADIDDHRKEKTFSNDKLRLCYLGPGREEKGFFLLKAALDKLWNERHDFSLEIHFSPKKISPYMKVNEKYGYGELEKIFDETDVLVAPSIWYETFGYTVLEALSYGVPVIISGNVGAKDIMVDGAGIVIENITAYKLYEVIRNLNIDSLQKMNKAITEHQKILTLPEMAKEVEELYVKR